METMDVIARRYGTDKSFLAHNYVRIYEKLFHSWRQKEIKLLEIGVWDNARSLRMWKDFFPNAKIIYGIDLDPAYNIDCGDRIKIATGDQSDPQFLDRILFEEEYFDIIIDDGSHQSRHQIATFEHLFPRLSNDGYYIVEDLHTSYWQPYLVGVTQSAIDYFKCLVDEINMSGRSGWGQVENDPDFKNLNRSYYETHVESIAFYKNIAVIEKR